MSEWEKAIAARADLIEIEPVALRPATRAHAKPLLTRDTTHRTAAYLAEHVFPVSARVILKTARRLNIGRKLGREIIFSNADVDRLYQGLDQPCRSKSKPA